MQIPGSMFSTPQTAERVWLVHHWVISNYLYFPHSWHWLGCLWEWQTPTPLPHFFFLLFEYNAMQIVVFPSSFKKVRWAWAGTSKQVKAFYSFYFVSYSDFPQQGLWPWTFLKSLRYCIIEIHLSSNTRELKRVYLFISEWGAIASVRRSEETVQQSIPFFPFLGLRDDTQVISLSKKCLYSLRHGLGPKQIFI